MPINESMENYLEMILILQNKKGCARSVDIAQELGVTKPSVTHATKILRKHDYIYMDQHNCIHFYEKGKKVAENIYEKHMTIARFLMSIGVQEDIAFHDACMMEHDISEETFDAIQNHLKKISSIMKKK